MSHKPVFFISHASKDKEQALIYKKILEDGFKEDLNTQIEVFVSSASTAIEIGREWFDTVVTKLDAADALIVLVTPSSIDRPWVWFEVGYFWKKRHDNKNFRIYPMYQRGIEIPSPINTLQGKIIGDEDKYFFEQLINDMGYVDENGDILQSLEDGNNSLEEPTSINQNEKQPDPFQDYSDADIEQIAREKLKRYIQDKYAKDIFIMQSFQATQEELGMDSPYIPKVFVDNYITYTPLDKEMGLPIGTSKRLLKTIANEYGLKVNTETDTGIKFQYEVKKSREQSE